MIADLKNTTSIAGSIYEKNMKYEIRNMNEG